MPSTYTLNNGIELIATGEQSGTWGDTTNTNLSLIDTALDGQVTITLASAGTSGSPNTLPISDGSASNGRNRLVIYTDGGDLGATAFVQLTPNDAEKIVYIRNNLSGGRALTVFQGTYNASNDYEIPAGTTAVIFFNGGGAGAVAANVFNNAFFDSLRLGGVSVTAILDEDNMASDSATALATQQSIKAYVDAQVTAQDLDFAGDTGTGAVDLDSQTFTIAGTANEIETSASGQTITVGLPNAVTIASLTATSADINGGTIDGTVIGGSTPAAISGTTGSFSGNLTVDTNTLFVDAANNRVGVGTASPLYTVEINDASGGRVALGDAFGQDLILLGGAAPEINVALASPLVFKTNNTERIRITSTGSVGVGVSSVNSNFIAQFNGNIGLGSPTRNQATTASIGVRTSDDPVDDARSNITFGTTAGASSSDSYIAFSTNQYGVSAGERMRITSTGLVGIGTSSPAYKLDVSLANNEFILAREASGNITNGFRISGPANENKAVFSANSATGEVNLGAINTNYFLTFSTNGANERMRIDSSGNVGIGTSSPNAKFTIDLPNHVGVGARFQYNSSNTPFCINALNNNGDAYIAWNAAAKSNSDTATYVISGAATKLEAGGGSFRFYNAASGTAGNDITFTERLRIDASGNVGIGTSSPDASSGLTIFSATYPSLYFDNNSATGGGAIRFHKQGVQQGLVAASGWILADTSNDISLLANTGNGLRFYTGGNNERMRIDSSGHLLVGATSSVGAGAHRLQLGSSGPTAQFLMKNSTGHAALYSTGNDLYQTWSSGGILALGNAPADGSTFTERMRIDSSGNVGIGTSSPSALAHVYNGMLQVGSKTGDTSIQQNTNAIRIAAVPNSTTEWGGLQWYREFSDYIGAEIIAARPSAAEAQTDLIFKTSGSAANATERMRIDSSGNLLVGKTVTTFTTDGLWNQPAGTYWASRTSDISLVLNRNGTDGDIVQFYKAGTTVGTIGYDGSYLYYGMPSGSIKFGPAENGQLILLTATGSGAPRLAPWYDNTTDLGSGSQRFDDIFATNGTIQTSDRNEKQDIEALSDAEQRVAVAAKGLLRKYRWKDAVAEKGDDARIHFGIIAQDLQAAFEAEGLDAGRYAMFIHSTWVDEETGEERSRMGVRYPQLLAFIIAAI